MSIKTLSHLFLIDFGLLNSNLRSFGAICWLDSKIGIFKDLIMAFPTHRILTSPLLDLYCNPMRIKTLSHLFLVDFGLLNSNLWSFGAICWLDSKIGIFKNLIMAFPSHRILTSPPLDLYCNPMRIKTLSHLFLNDFGLLNSNLRPFGAICWLDSKIKFFKKL